MWEFKSCFITLCDFSPTAKLNTVGNDFSFGREKKKLQIPEHAFHRDYAGWHGKISISSIKKAYYIHFRWIKLRSYNLNGRVSQFQSNSESKFGDIQIREPLFFTP